MNTDYAMYFNYNNDKKVYCIPILPEKIKMTVKGQTTSVNIDQAGELLFKGKRDAAVVSFSSFFPAQFEQSICSCSEEQFKDPEEWVEWIKYLQERKKPAHIVLHGSTLGINMYMDITNFVPEEVGGDPGTLQYSIELKEHREVTVRTYKKKSKKKAKVTNKKKRTNNKETPTDYTVKSGDCLWNIAIKQYGKKNGAMYTKIYEANKDAIEKAAKAHGYSSSNNGNRIWPGIKLTIPAA